MSDLLGVRIRTNAMLDDVPRMTVSPVFAALMPPKFVQELNAWMYDFFGTHSVTMQAADGTVIMGTKAYARLKQALIEKQAIKERQWI